MATYHKVERACEECGESFWGTSGANFCSAACRSRDWRRRRAQQHAEALVALCQQVASRGALGRASYSKLLPRLLRATAAELRRLGRDPVQLLAGKPEDPVTEHDEAPGGIEGQAPHRVKRLYAPEVELGMLDEAITRRRAEGRSVAWHLRRSAQLLRALTAELEGESESEDLKIEDVIEPEPEDK